MQEIESDKRFYINPTTLKDIFRRCQIDRYELCTTNLGKLRRTLYGNLSPLYKSEPYQLLTHPSEERAIKQYQNYCEIPGARKDNPNRSLQYYENFIKDFSEEDYDIHKGIIVVDQFYRIQEGLHRSCILLKRYGSPYAVQVLKIHLQLSLKNKCRCYLRMFWYDTKRILHFI